MAAVEFTFVATNHRAGAVVSPQVPNYLLRLAVIYSEPGPFLTNLPQCSGFMTISQLLVATLTTSLQLASHLEQQQCTTWSIATLYPDYMAISSLSLRREIDTINTL